MSFLTGVTPSTDDVSDLLREHGVSPTLHRVQIAQLFYTRKCHLSADEVLGKVNTGRNVVSKATVYNTLRIFSKQNVLQAVVADPARVYYEPVTDNHHHFYDVDSGELTDIDPSEVSIKNIPAPPDGADVLGVSLVISIGSSVTAKSAI